MAGGTVDGLISGLDTTSIISQLMQLERQPVTRLEQKRTNAMAITTAYQQVNSKFVALRDAADPLTKADFWQGRTATSSSTSVAVTASTGALAGSFTFDVEQVAAGWSYVSSSTYTSTSAPVTSAPSITLTKGSTDPVTVDVGDGSLAAVVSGINAAKAGVRAAATQVAPGEYRLQLTSTTTGADSNFSIAAGADTAPLGALDVLVTGQDARIAVGQVGAPGRYTVTSPTNTLTDVMPGVTLTVKGEATGVTVDVVDDVAAISKQVEAMVTAANGVLSEIKKLTAYDPATKKGGVLVGDSTVRALQQEVLRLASSSVGSAAGAGVQLDRNGLLTFDKGTFNTAYADDPAAVERLFRPTGTTAAVDGSVDGTARAGTISLFYADDRTMPGSYDVKVTAAATRANARLTGTAVAGDTVTLQVTGKDDVVVTAASADPTEIAAQLNLAIADAGLGLVAVVDGADVLVRSTAYGSKPTFALSATGGLTAGATTAGTDVAGTINGVVATGDGQALSAPSTDAALRGLSFTVRATAQDVADAALQAGDLQHLFGTFTYAPGIAQRLDSFANDAIRSSDGRLTTAIAGQDSKLKSLEDEIASWEPRLELREKALRRQYANLEVALGKMREQSNWLAGQVSGLMANNG